MTPLEAAFRAGWEALDDARGVQCEQDSTTVDEAWAAYVAQAKTTLTSIGYLGWKRVYINVPTEQAEARYIASEGQLEGDTEIYTFFGDEFWAYDVGNKL